MDAKGTRRQELILNDADFAEVDARMRAEGFEPAVSAASFNFAHGQAPRHDDDRRLVQAWNEANPGAEAAAHERCLMVQDAHKPITKEERRQEAKKDLRVAREQRAADRKITVRS